MRGDIRTYAGVPPVEVFGGSWGTPLVVDTTASILYYLLGNTVTAIGGAPASGVSSVAVTPGSGIAASVANPTTTPNISIALASVATLQILANITGGSAAPIPNGLSAIIDAILGNTQGQVITRNAGTWTVLAPGAANTVLTSNGAGANLSYAAPVASLQFWAESQSTSAPNGTIAASRFIPVNAAFTDIDAVISPKGNSGAILGQLPNNAISQGNKRGAHAVDFQLERDAATSVASGGQTFIGSGRDNSATSQYAGVGCGNANTASGSGSWIGGGINNLAGGTNSWIPGGSQASTRGLTCKGAFSSGTPSAAGDAQGGVMHLRRFTSDGTASALTASATAASTTNIDVMPNLSTYLFQAMVVAHKDSTNSAGWIIEGLIARDAGVGTTIIIGTNVTRSWGTNAGAPPAGWNVTVTADTTNGAPLVTVTGAAATQIYWSGVVRTTEARG